MEIDKNKVIIYLVVVIFLLLFLRLVQLQIVEGEGYQKLSRENAARTVPIRAPRGIIYDRNGKVIASNQPVFSVQILPHILASKSKAEREKIAAKLSSILEEKVELKISVNQPAIIKDHISLEKVLALEEHRRELEGIAVNSRAVRSYPEGKIATHLLGYVREIETKELEKLKAQGYKSGDLIGKEGVEKIYDKYLRGKDGGEKIEVDVYGTPLRIVESLDPIPGADMKLTVDIELQKAVEEAMGEHEGAVVVMDPRTGEILALASHPHFDPSIFSFPLEKWRWEREEGRRYPFMNRALALYPPGSIFKVVTLTAALEEGKAKPDEIIYCPGYYKLNNRIAKCWKEGGHGSISVMEGLVWSCDTVFYELGRRLGPELMAKYAKAYGLGEKTEIDLPQEKKGVVPTEAWKNKVLKEPWYAGDSINMGIGQGFIQVTPLQIASVYGTVATGKRFKPCVVSEIKDRSGNVLYQASPKELGKVPLSEDHLQLIREALSEVVRRGTGVAAKVSGIPAAGKTGTAENPGRPHAWFICYVPYDDPEIVIASFVVHGEHGDRAPAYIARDILEWYKNYRLTKVYSEEAE